MKILVFKPELAYPSASVQVAWMSDTGVPGGYDSVVVPLAGLTDLAGFQAAATQKIIDFATSKGKTVTSADISFV